MPNTIKRLYEHRWTRWQQCLTVFAAALLVRLLHGCLFAQHRLCLGSTSMEFLGTARDLLLHSGSQASAIESAGRILLHGYPFIAYLCGIEWLLGISSSHPAIEPHWWQFGLVNSLLDSAACVAVYLAASMAFGRKTALLAALMLVLAPAAVLNTQVIAREPFAHALICLWIYCVFRMLLLPVCPRWVYFLTGFSAAVFIAVSPPLAVIPLAVLAFVKWLPGLCLSAEKAEALQMEGSGGQRDLPADGAVIVPTGGGIIVSEEMAGIYAQPLDLPQDASLTIALVAKQKPLKAMSEEMDFSPQGAETQLQAQTNLPGPQDGVAPVANNEETAGDWQQTPEVATTVKDAAAAGESPLAGAGESLVKDAAAAGESSLVAAGESLSGTVEKETDQPGKAQATEHRCLNAGASWIALGALVPAIVFVWMLALNSWQYLAAIARHLESGSLLSSDGWGCVAGQQLPAASPWAAFTLVCREFLSQPLAVLGLELSKFARLWCASWNDYKYPWLLLSPNVIDTVHEIILMLALLSMVLVWPAQGKRVSAKSVLAVSVLLGVGFAHLIFLIGDPVARFAYTAAPALALLSSFALSRLFHRQDLFRALALLASLLGLAVIFWNLKSGAGLLPLLCLLPEPMLFLVPYLNAFALAAVWAGVAMLVLYMVPHAGRLAARKFIYCACAAAALLAASGSLWDPATREWSSGWMHTLKLIGQDIYMPPLQSGVVPGPVSFILLDLESAVLSPRLSIKVNNIPVITLPVPWLQVEGRANDQIYSFNAQSKAMGTDMRSFRQWWAVPIPTVWLRVKDKNRIVIGSGAPDAPVDCRIYGDYQFAGMGNDAQHRILPSLMSTSMNKAFKSLDHYDSRLYKRWRLSGEMLGSSVHDATPWRSDDLSEHFGKQIGEYRIHIAVPYTNQPEKRNPVLVPGIPEDSQSAEAARVGKPIVLLNETGAQGVSGSEPDSMSLTPGPLKLPPLEEGSRYLLACELMSLDSESAHFNIEFSGKSAGHEVTWVSAWQPQAIDVSPDWRPVIFSSEIAPFVSRLKDLCVSITLLPYQADKGLAQPGQARFNSAAVRNARFVILPPLKLPPPDQRNWLIY